ncbi:MAG: DUF2927 domain-containing protein, partial [Saprospiraceae bacterium]|nr:DUF2927 domain-containing protein [Saprospiraceae bacterium]
SNNFGLVWIYWSNQSQIYKGSMYVDISRVPDPACRKHLLREELTQSLGLLNDSFRYSESIFFQNWTCTDFYLDVDRKVLEYHFNPAIEEGMSRSEAEAVLLRL